MLRSTNTTGGGGCGGGGGGCPAKHPAGAKWRHGKNSQFAQSCLSELGNGMPGRRFDGHWAVAEIRVYHRSTVDLCRTSPKEQRALIQLGLRCRAWGMGAKSKVKMAGRAIGPAVLCAVTSRKSVGHIGVLCGVASDFLVGPRCLIQKAFVGEITTSGSERERSGPATGLMRM